VKFKTKSLRYRLIIGYEQKFIKEITNTKFTEEFIITFIGKVIDQMTPKLSLDHVYDQLYRHSLDDLLCIYSLCNKVRDNFWGGNSSDMARTFILQKKNRIMAGVGSRRTCRRLFKNLHILPVRCQYIFSLIFVLDKWEMFRSTPCYMLRIHETGLKLRGLLTKNTGIYCCDNFIYVAI